MMRAVALITVLLAAIIGWVFQADPYRLADLGMPSDQAALAHRDSPYTHVTWVVSKGDNYAEMRFYDKVEGGICIRPTWADLADIDRDGSLAHLYKPADYEHHQVEVDRNWPHDWRPDPGSLAHTRYVSLYPLGVLLNQRLHDEGRGAAPNIMVVGLGSGVGIALLAHHFPEASITVVDIDQVVNDMVRDHFPMLNWLERHAPPLSDGRHRLRLVTADARQFLHFPSLRGDDPPYDLVILDAYTAGSTIPPHLMTREFFAEVGAAMAPGGILLSNIIGSYTGEKRRVLGGAIRSQRAAGLTEVLNIPIHQRDPRRASFNIARNNIILASTEALSPRDARASWQRLDAWIAADQPYANLPTDRFVTRSAVLYHRSEQRWLSAKVPLAPDGPTADIVAELDRRWQDRTDRDIVLDLDDSMLTDRLREAIQAAAAADGRSVPRGWEREQSQAILRYSQDDWVRLARTTVRNSIAVARTPAGASGLEHGGANLVGPLEGERDDGSVWRITDAPLFTDAQPNADILNH